MGTPIPDVEVSISLVGSKSRYGHTIPVTANRPKTDLLGRWHFDGVPPDAETVSLRFLHERWAMFAAPIISSSIRPYRDKARSNLSVILLFNFQRAFCRKSHLLAHRIWTAIFIESPVI